ncbi:MAG: hypothetical protein V7637_529 [Mycobacteriales bacterium]
MTNRITSVTATVSTPGGQVIGISAGEQLVFGRGEDADLTIPAGPGLSRRAGVIAAMDRGSWVANLSRTHALYIESEGARVRLPRLEDRGDPSGGWFVRTGSVLVGSRAMLDEGRPLRVTVVDPDAADGTAAIDDDTGANWSAGRPAGDATVVPLSLDPMTKLFLVALLWCRPWLVDPSRGTPLPRTPEIARAALEVTDAFYELELFDSDPAFRDRLAARVGEHLKVLRHKISERGLVRPGVRLSDEVTVDALIEHAIITSADLAHLTDPAWCSRQENLWWTERPGGRPGGPGSPSRAP